jgi:hypothetical protein
MSPTMERPMSLALVLSTALVATREGKVPADDRTFWIDFYVERCRAGGRGFKVIEGNLPLVRNYG